MNDMQLIIAIIFEMFVMAFWPIMVQFKSEINNAAFDKLIKLKHFSFMFRAPNGEPMSREGVALPIFISQVLVMFFRLSLAY